MKKTLNTLAIVILLLVAATTTIHAQYIIHIAGNDSIGYYGDGGPALQASLYRPLSICRDVIGNLYIGDGSQNAFRCFRIRKIDAATGIITTIAGKIGPYSPTGDSADVIAATNARFAGLPSLCLDKDGNLLIADGVQRLRKMNLTTGIVTTVAGSTTATGYAGDGGPATAALVNTPMDVVVDKTNNIYFAERLNNVIRRVDAVTGIITTVVGDGTGGYAGDGGPATAAKINDVYGICIDSSDNLYIADRANVRIRKVDALTGIITTIAGTGTIGATGDGGPATAALLSFPIALAIDKQQNVYVRDGSSNISIRKIDATTGIITTIAGNGTPPPVVDSIGDGGPATAANVASYRMCFDTCGALYIGGSGCRIRAIVPTLPTTNKICGYTINAVQDVPTYNAAALSIYPNPNDGQFSINLSTTANMPLHISITDITGRTIKEITTTSNKDTPLQLSTPPGMYFIQATTENGRWSKKVVVQ